MFCHALLHNSRNWYHACKVVQWNYMLYDMVYRISFQLWWWKLVVGKWKVSYFAMHESRSFDFIFQDIPTHNKCCDIKSVREWLMIWKGYFQFNFLDKFHINSNFPEVCFGRLGTKQGSTILLEPLKTQFTVRHWACLSSGACAQSTI